MKRVLTVFAATLIAAAGFAATGNASSMQKHMMAKSMTCPACHMKMPTTKTAMMTVPVKIKGVTYYCCSGCPAGKAHMAKPKPKSTM